MTPGGTNETSFITGAGVVSPIGKNFQELMDGIAVGKKGIGAIHWASAVCPPRSDVFIRMLIVLPTYLTCHVSPNLSIYFSKTQKNRLIKTEPSS